MKTNTIYWILTGLFAAGMFLSAIPDVMMSPEAIDFIKHLGYPLYFVPFIGVLKILGVIAILVPGFPRIKEWAYAGLFFDLIGAIYSVIAIGEPVVSTLPIFIFAGVGIGSYIFYHKKMKGN